VRALPLCLLLSLTLALAPRTVHAERLRDLADVSGARPNQLLGYGLVTGLGGTGDDLAVSFTAQSVLAMLRRLGVQVDPGQLRLRNVAAVVVTATLPAFARPGTRVDVTVSSVGNARSLSGGVLLQTVLRGADQHAYAIAQGPLVVGGFVAQGSTGSSVRSGYPTTARIAEGATVEREVPTTMVAEGNVRLDLRTPGFTVASRIVAAVNQRFGEGTASAPDAGAVLVRAPADGNLVGFLAALEDLEVVPLRRARVVLNERTGTLVAGGDVRLAPAVVVHGGLTVVVRETPTVSQPAALGAGTTTVVPNSDVTAEEPLRTATLIPAAPTLADVARTLNRLGLSPRELGSVLEALRAAGALEAELVVQ
jgi:flagellar P-ring protein precursor FlgI